MKNLTEGSTKTNIKKIDPSITKAMVLPPPAPKPSKSPLTDKEVATIKNPKNKL